jgi:hypothetical protein
MFAFTVDRENQGKRTDSPVLTGMMETPKIVFTPLVQGFVRLLLPGGNLGPGFGGVPREIGARGCRLHVNARRPAAA